MKGVGLDGRRELMFGGEEVILDEFIIVPISAMI